MTTHNGSSGPSSSTFPDLDQPDGWMRSQIKNHAGIFGDRRGARGRV